MPRPRSSAAARDENAHRELTRSIRFDTAAYLEQCRSVAEELLSTRAVAIGTTHPEHYVRGYATWLFFESDLYRELTGAGPASRAIADVNTLLAPLVAVHRAPTAPNATAKPTPRSVSTSMPANARDASGAPAAPAAETRPVVRRTDAVPGALADARAVLDNAARVAGPPLRRLVDVARSHFGPTERVVEAKTALDLDPLDEERRELEARFEELERRMKDEQGKR